MRYRPPGWTTKPDWINNVFCFYFCCCQHLTEKKRKVWPMLAIWTNAYFIYSQKSLEPFHFSIDSEIAQKPLDKWVTPQMVYSVKWGDRAEAMGLWDCHDECLFVFLMLYWTFLTTQKGGMTITTVSLLDNHTNRSVRPT